MYQKAKVEDIIFFQWIIACIMIVSVYVIRYLGIGQILKGETTFYMNSLSSVFGLMMPQLVVMISFYMTSESKKNVILITKRKAILCVIMTFVYLSVFVSCLIYGIGHFGFGIPSGGRGLLHNTSVVVSIAGFFSILGMLPITALFRTD